GLDNGLTAQEIGELITHLAFYSGWPTAMSAVTETKKVFEERGTRESATREGPRVETADAGEIRITRKGEGKTNAPDQYFTGHVETSGFYKGDAPARVAGATVSFPAGARTAWHTHPLGQTLFVVSGRGWIQKDGGPIEEM
ncbi:carboxymuconolactone decarboxylase family protein, partial [Rhizobiaceae sp. 2RAB30]